MKQLITTAFALSAILILAISWDVSTITFPPPPPSSGVYEKNDFEYQDYYRSRFANYKIPDLVPHKDIPNFYFKVPLGRAYFFHKENGIGCVSCHFPEHGFTAGEQQSVAGDDKPWGKSRTPIFCSASEITLANGAGGSIGINLTSSKVGDKFEINHLMIGGVGSQAFIGQDVHDHEFTPDSLLLIPGVLEMAELAYPNMDQKHYFDNINIMECLVAFEMTLEPRQSKQQQFLRGEISLTNDVLLGWESFDQKCSGCHGGAHMGKDAFAKTNTPPFSNENHDESILANLGRYSFTGFPEDKGYFDITSLNTNLTDHGCWGFSCESDSLPQFIQNHQLAYDSKPLTESEVNNLMAFFEACNDPRLSLVGTEY